MVKFVRYFIIKDTNKFGPFTDEEVKELLMSGSIDLNDLAAPEGSIDFRPLSQFNLLQSSSSPSTYQSHPTVSPTYQQSYSQSNPNQYSQYSNSQPSYSEFKGDFETLPPIKNNSSMYITEEIGLKKYHKKDLLSETFEIMRDKILSWLLIAFTPFAFTMILMFKNFGIIMQQAIALNKAQVVSVNPQDLIQLVILGILTFYTSLASLVMIITGTAEYHGGIDFSLTELFLSIQPKIPKFFVVSLLFGFGLSLIFIPISLLPVEFRKFALIMGIILYFVMIIRLLPLPMVLTLEELGFIDSIKLSYTITEGNVGRILKLLFITTICIVLIGFITQSLALLGISFFGILILIINLLFNVGILVLFTLFYLDLVERAKFDGKI